MSVVSPILNQFIIASVTSLTSGPSLWQELIVHYHSLKGFHSLTDTDRQLILPHMSSLQRNVEWFTGGGHVNTCHLI